LLEEIEGALLRPHYLVIPLLLSIFWSEDFKQPLDVS